MFLFYFVVLRYEDLFCWWEYNLFWWIDFIVLLYVVEENWEYLDLFLGLGYDEYIEVLEYNYKLKSCIFFYMLIGEIWGSGSLKWDVIY